MNSIHGPHAQGNIMNMRTGWLPLVLAGLIACSGNGGTDAIDAHDAVDNRVCLGALPTSEFRDLAVTPGGTNECAQSPGVWGNPIAIQPGGWLIQTYPNNGCSDLADTRITWLKPDGCV